MQHVAGLDPVRPLQGPNSAVYRYGEAGIQRAGQQYHHFAPSSRAAFCNGCNCRQAKPQGPQRFLIFCIEGTRPACESRTGVQHAWQAMTKFSCRGAPAARGGKRTQGGGPHLSERLSRHTSGTKGSSATSEAQIGLYAHNRPSQKLRASTDLCESRHGSELLNVGLLRHPYRFKPSFRTSRMAVHGRGLHYCCLSKVCFFETCKLCCHASPKI